MASDDVRPGDSMPCSEIKPGCGCVMEKSTAVSPFRESLGRMPESAKKILSQQVGDQAKGGATHSLAKSRPP